MISDSFPDLMREAGITDGALMQEYSDAVEALAGQDQPAQTLRLVELAHEKPLRGESDEWFWRRFREADGAFPLAEAIPLHSRLAASVLQISLQGSSALPGLLVCLAALEGWQPQTPLLQQAAEDALARHSALPPLPTAKKSRKVWSKSVDEAVFGKPETGEEAPAAAPGDMEVDSQMLRALGTTFGESIDSAVVSVVNQVDRVAQWAAVTQAQLSREQSVMRWLIAGQRSDGTRWSDLSPSTVAVDGAAELTATLGYRAPTASHEALVALVLRASGADPDEQIDATPQFTSELPEVPPDLAELARVHANLSEEADLGEVSVGDASRRILWEAAALAAWSGQ